MLFRPVSRSPGSRRRRVAEHDPGRHLHAHRQIGAGTPTHPERAPLARLSDKKINFLAAPVLEGEIVPVIALSSMVELSGLIVGRNALNDWGMSAAATTGVVAGSTTAGNRDDWLACMQGSHCGGHLGKLIAALSALTISASALAGQLAVSLPGHGSLAMPVPDGWAATVRRVSDDLPPTVVVTAKPPNTFQMLVTPIWPMGSGKPPRLGEIQSLVEGAAARVEPESVERSLPLRPLKGVEAAGYYFSATDPAPGPNGYKYMTQGALMLKELRITFTVLINGDAAEPTRQALEMLKAMHRVAPNKPTTH